MAVNQSVLIESKHAENAQTTQYTSASAKTIIDSFKVCNTSAGAVTFSINLVPSGGSAGNDNLFLDAKSIAPGETYICPEVVGETLGDGGFISTIAGAVTSLAIRASGRVIT